MTSYVPLRVHSDLSLGYGASSTKSIAKRAGKIAAPACALTDMVSMSGCYKFSGIAASEGVQPIIGCQFFLRKGDVEGDVIFLAKSNEGYININHILEMAFAPKIGKNKAEYVPDIPILDVTDELFRFLDDVIVLSGSGSEGIAYSSLKKDGGALLRSLAQAARDNFYVEICRRNGAVDVSEKTLLDFAYGSHGAEYPIVGTTDSWYAAPDDILAYEMLSFSRGDRKDVILLDGVKWESEGVLDIAPAIKEQLVPKHIPDPETFSEWFADLPEAIDNTIAISKRTCFLVEDRKPVLPPFSCPAGMTENDVILFESRRGLDEKIAQYGLDRAVYSERLEFELAVILRMGFPGYFLIVSDFIKWAKNNGVSVGPGRGSGAGSLVAWCLHITDIDPIPNGLLFERFLNPERVSMPDFDIDFEPDGREAVLEYVRKKYGASNVAAISAFGSILAKSAIDLAARSVAVVGGKGIGDVQIAGFSDVNRVRSFLPEVPGNKDNLQKVVDENQDLQSMLARDSRSRMLVAVAQKVEGLYSHQTRHAAGVVIGGDSLYKMFPVIRDRKTMFPMTGYDMKGTEAVGAVKFDFLGLNNLSIIDRTIQLMREDGITDEIDTSLADPAAYRLLRDGLTQGVFQFSGGGMVQALQQVRPDKFSEIVAITALFRPGPMKYLSSYANRKLGREEIIYPLAKYAVAENVPDMSPSEICAQFSDKIDKDTIIALEGFGDINDVSEKTILSIQATLKNAGVPFRVNPKWPSVGNKIVNSLSETYGYFVYQEQVMLVARDVAGYTYAGADMLRRAMGKKIREEMTRQAGIFVEGCAANGVAEEDAMSLFQDIERFADYGFNKSHAVAYTVVSYQTVWLKVHFPEHFYAALLFRKKKDKAATRIIMDEMVVYGVKMSLPDINTSMQNHKPNRFDNGDWYVMFGLSGIGGMDSVADALVTEREKGGSFASLVDFWKRTRRILNIRHYTALTASGALDDLDPYRKPHTPACRQRILLLLTWLQNAPKQDQKQSSMFGDESYVFPDAFSIKHHINKKHVIEYRTDEMPDWHDRGVREFDQVGFSPSRIFMLENAAKLTNAGFRMSSGLCHMMEAARIKEMEDVRMVVLPEMLLEKVNIWGLDKRFERARAFKTTDGFDEVIVYATGPGAAAQEKVLLQAMNDRKPVALFGKFQRFGWRNKVLFARIAVDAESYLFGVNPSPDVFVVMNDDMTAQKAFRFSQKLEKFRTTNPYGGRITLMTEKGLEGCKVPVMPDREWRLRGHKFQDFWPVTEQTGFDGKYEKHLFEITPEVMAEISQMPDVVRLLTPIDVNIKASPDAPRLADAATMGALLASETFWEVEQASDYGVKEYA